MAQDQLCQHVRALDLDEETERILLDALAPDNLAIAVATIAEVAGAAANAFEARLLAQRGTGLTEASTRIPG